MNPTLRAVIVIAGVLCFAAAAIAQAGWWLNGADPTALALCGFGLWLWSTIRLP